MAAICVWNRMSAPMNAFGVAQIRPLQIEGFAKRRDVGRRRLGRGLAHHAALEETARLLEMFERVGRGRQHHMRGGVDLLKNRLRRGLAHLGALAMGDRQQPHVAELLHRLADRRTSDAEALHQIPFRRHGVARLQFAARDQRFQPVEHFVRQFAANDGIGNQRHEQSFRETRRWSRSTPFRFADFQIRNAWTACHRGIGSPAARRNFGCVISSDDIVIIPASKATCLRRLARAPENRSRPNMSQSVIRMTYRIETSGDVAALAAKIASDQSTGTFVATPGETPELKARVGARVVASARARTRFDAVLSRDAIRTRAAPIRAARRTSSFRLDAIGTDLAALTTIAIGGVFSIKGFSGIRIVDMKLPPEFGAAHPGPQFGVAGSRALTGVKRPADHRHDRQAGARPAPARDRRVGARTGGGRRRLHQGRREVDEPGLFEPGGSGEGDHADHPRSRAEDRQEGDVRLRHFACRSRGDAAQPRHRRRRRRQRGGHQHQFDRLRRLLVSCASARASSCTPIATVGTSSPAIPASAWIFASISSSGGCSASTSFRSTASAPNIGSRTNSFVRSFEALTDAVVLAERSPAAGGGLGPMGRSGAGDLRAHRPHAGSALSLRRRHRQPSRRPGRGRQSRPAGLGGRGRRHSPWTSTPAIIANSPNRSPSSAEAKNDA